LRGGGGNILFGLCLEGKGEILGEGEAAGHHSKKNNLGRELIGRTRKPIPTKKRPTIPSFPREN